MLNFVNTHIVTSLSNKILILNFFQKLIQPNYIDIRERECFKNIKMRIFWNNNVYLKMFSPQLIEFLLIKFARIPQLIHFNIDKGGIESRQLLF